MPLREEAPSTTDLKYADEIIAVNTVLADKVAETVAAGQFPIILGGDHSIAMGSIAGLLRLRPQIGVLWFDAHGDFNTEETSLSGNIHGMPAAVAVGRSKSVLTQLFSQRVMDESKFVYVGVRDLDADEAQLLRTSKATVFSMHDVDRYGMREIIARALEILSCGTDGVHLSIDIDVVDPIFAPGSGTPVSGGLTEREAHLACELLAQSDVLTSMDMVEVNPILDSANRTGRLAADLIASALGKHII